MTPKRKAKCEFCGRMIRVTDPGNDCTPWFKTHMMGKGADRAGGQTSRSRCCGSLMAAPKEKAGTP